MAVTQPVQAWLVRHARPLIEPGVCYGRSEVEADPADTERAAARLHALLPPETRVWTSPRRRCTALADALARWRPGLAAQVDERLAEMDFGCWEGWRWDAIERAALDRWQADFAHERFGGRESVQQLLDRVAAAWDQAQRLSQPWVWITHAGVIRATHLLAQGRRGVRHGHEWPTDALPFGAAFAPVAGQSSLAPL